MSIWRSFQQRMDNIVDRQFSEPVWLIPWIKGKYTSEGVADASRVVVKTIGIYVQPGAAVTGEGGTMGGGMDLRTVTQDVWLSIMDNLVDPKDWVDGDRVYWPERKELFEVSWPDSSATGRPNIHLIRLQSNVSLPE